MIKGLHNFVPRASKGNARPGNEVEVYKEGPDKQVDINPIFQPNFAPIPFPIYLLCQNQSPIQILSVILNPGHLDSIFRVRKLGKYQFPFIALKKLNQCILSYFDHVQSYLEWRKT